MAAIAKEMFQPIRCLQVAMFTMASRLAQSIFSLRCSHDCS
jgi:hypothetical protein